VVPVEVLMDALIFSTLLALLAIGLTMTYLTLKVPNFAHGDLAAVGVYTSFTLLKFWRLHLYFSLPLAFLIGGSISLATYLAVYRPLWRRGAGVVALMIASIAVEVVLRSLMHIYADTVSSALHTFARGFSYAMLDVYLEAGGRTVPLVLAISTATLAGLVVSLYVFLTMTRFGIAMRAAIENPALASTLGINVDLVYAVSWFLAGALASVAGVFLPFRMPASPEIGWEMLLRTFTASVLGGLGSIFGAVLGGFLAGFAEVFGIYLLSQPPITLSTAYRPALPYALFIIVLLAAPRGITGIEWSKVFKRGGSR